MKHSAISLDRLVLFSSLTIISRANQQKVKIFSGKIILVDSLELLSHSAQWYHYIPTCMLCLCVQCMYMWKYVACIWKVEVAWPMGSHFVEWWGSLLRRWVRRTSPHFVACHFTLRQTIRLTLSTPNLDTIISLDVLYVTRLNLPLCPINVLFCFLYEMAWLLPFPYRHFVM